MDGVKPGLFALFWGALLAGAACGGAPPNLVPGVSPAGVSPAELPLLRLSPDPRPLRYQVELRLAPGEPRVQGTIDIDLALRQPAQSFVLHGVDLQIAEAVIEYRGARVALGWRPALQERLRFSSERPIGPGDARLHIAYSAPLSARETAGLFRQQEGGAWYAYSNFEPTDARRAFPCFDEPSFKVPWRVILHVPRDHAAFSNAPVEDESDEPGGMKRVRFRETRPLPSYLLALAVGPFETVAAGRAGRGAIPLRVIVPRGRAAEARYAARITPQLLTLLEDFFDAPYPYEKLDQIAVPHFSGAMENAGLVTYSELLLLSRPEAETVKWRRHLSRVCAHELAHQWMGDQVTPGFWEDIWLNESFANFAESKALARWPAAGAWAGEEEALETRAVAMLHDSLRSARRVRQPIRSVNDIGNLFDAITYAKGEALLRMFEGWVGAARFRQGLQRYLRRHAYGNASSADFLAALSEETGQDLAGPVSGFLDQVGVPQVAMELRCGPDAAPRLALSRSRYLPVGALAMQLPARWQVPVCVRYGRGGREQRQCTLLAADQAELVLTTPGCPEWVLGNDGEIGYYRVEYRGDLLGRLLERGREHLGLAERIGVLDDLNALLRGGMLSAAQVLQWLPAFAGDRRRPVIEATLELLGGLEELVPEAERPRYARFVQQLYGKPARALGFAPRPGEDEDRRLLRVALLDLVARRAQDPALVREATRLAWRWLKDRRAVDPEVLEVVLSAAAAGGDQRLFRALYGAARATASQGERVPLLRALGRFRQPKTAAAALAVLLADEFEPREELEILASMSREPETRELGYRFVKENLGTLSGRLPRFLATRLLRSGVNLCDRRYGADLADTFGRFAQRYPGGPRTLAQVREQVGLCAALKERQQASLTEFLKGY